MVIFHSFPIKHGDFPSFFVCLPGRVLKPQFSVGHTEQLGFRNFISKQKIEVHTLYMNK